MQALTFFFAFVVVLALIGVVAWLIRRFASNRLGANTNAGGCRVWPSSMPPRSTDAGGWCWSGATTSNTS